MAKRFSDLTSRGRALRLRRLAEAALLEYDLEVTRLRLVTNAWNCVFRVDTRDGPRVLRVTLPRVGLHQSVASEVAFMEALGSETDIDVPRVVANRFGDPVTIAVADGVPEPRSCVVFRWLGGHNLGERVSPENWELLGELMAKMHRFGEEWPVPRGFQALAYDAVIHYGEPLILFDPGRVDLLTNRELFERAWRATEERIKEINGRTPPFIVHADLHQWNVKIKRGVLSPFDFEDLLYSAPILDVATTLHYVRFRSDYQGLGSAFRAGYERHRRWVESEPGELDRLLISRALDLMNVVALEPEVEVGNWSSFVSRRAELARVAVGELPPVEI